MVTIPPALAEAIVHREAEEGRRSVRPTADDAEQPRMSGLSRDHRA
ncbi:hypothetical protein ACQEU6_24965 [Spirillospora sp. CA-108201]